MSDTVKKYFCPRLLDYIILIGPSSHPDKFGGRTSPSLGARNFIPHLLRRYPLEDHKDFALPPDVVIFCQPEGCDQQEAIPNSYNDPSQNSNSFVFLLTEKDTSRVRYGVCLNFYRPIQRIKHRSESSNERSREVKGAHGTDGSHQGSRDCHLKVGDHSSNLSKDDESGIRVSMGLDSDSACSSRMTVGSSVNQSKHLYSDQANSTTLVSSENVSASIGGTESITSSNSGCKIALNSNENDSYHAHSKDQPHSLPHSHGRKIHSSVSRERSKVTYALYSICIISHHPFFSTFRECLLLLKKYIQACEERNRNLRPIKDSPNCVCHMKRSSGARRNSQQFHSLRSNRSPQESHHQIDCPFSHPIWTLLTCPEIDESMFSPSTIADVAEIEAWLFRLLSVPVPVPEKTKIELEVLPRELRPPLIFALPDHTRFSLIDFPLHLPLELLGVQTCLQVLTCILLEHKVALQSKDYNALSMSVMAFVTMIYPLEYMFPVIPLLPSCMGSAEQLLLAPTPFIIGFPSSFLKFKSNFVMPNDVWIVDLDTNKVKQPPNVESLPMLPEREGSILMQDLQKILNSMSGTENIPVASLQSSADNIQLPSAKSNVLTRPNRPGDESPLTPSSPFKRRSSLAAAGQFLQLAANRFGNSNTSLASRSNSPSSSTRTTIAVSNVPTFDPMTIIQNDTDAVDVAVRIAMARFFNSQEVLANFIEHTRTIRLYPRPVVSFQKSSLIQSRVNPSPFLMKLVETQAVEFLAEWALSPDNVAFQRIQTGVYDPATIGDKPKWYGHQLDSVHFTIWDGQCKEFYDNICAIMDDPGGLKTSNASSGKFNDYLESTADGQAESELDDYDEVDNHELTLDLSKTALEEDGHSPYITSNDSSPCYSSDREVDDWEAENASDGRLLTLDDVINSQIRKSSICSSISSNASWVNDQTMRSIPANYQHDIGSFPPIRCDISKHFKPFDHLVTSIEEKDKNSIQKANEKSQIYDESTDSLDDDNDSSKVVASTSSFDESGSEESDFDSDEQNKRDPDENTDGVIKLFDSVDSDTLVPSNQTDSSIDINNDAMTSSTKHQSTIDSSDNMSLLGCQDLLNTESQLSNSRQKVESFAGSDTVNAIISSQKMKVTSGVAKLIDRASSITDPANQSQRTKNLAGKQMGALLGKVTSEARGAVMEAKAAINAGKIALKSTTTADIGRQRLIRNIQNLGEALFEEKRDSLSMRETTNEVPREIETQKDARSPSLQPKAPEVITDKASSIGGWLGSKATGLANRMRPLAPFPQSKFMIRQTGLIYLNS